MVTPDREQTQALAVDVRRRRRKEEGTKGLPQRHRGTESEKKKPRSRLSFSALLTGSFFACWQDFALARHAVVAK
jgi:hypothetical protein